MHKAKHRRVFASLTPSADLLTTPRLSTHTNEGWGEHGMVPLDKPGDVEARRLLNKAPGLSLGYDVGWGEPSRGGTTAQDITMMQKYLEAVRIKNRTSSSRKMRAFASAPIVIPLAQKRK